MSVSIVGFLTVTNFPFLQSKLTKAIHGNQKGDGVAVKIATSSAQKTESSLDKKVEEEKEQTANMSQSVSTTTKLAAVYASNQMVVSIDKYGEIIPTGATALDATLVEWQFNSKKPYFLHYKYFNTEQNDASIPFFKIQFPDFKKEIAKIELVGSSDCMETGRSVLWDRLNKKDERQGAKRNSGILSSLEPHALYIVASNVGWWGDSGTYFIEVTFADSSKEVSKPILTIIDEDQTRWGLGLTEDDMIEINDLCALNDKANAIKRNEKYTAIIRSKNLKELQVTASSTLKKIPKTPLPAFKDGIGSNDLVIGNGDSKVFIVEYSETDCPACASFHKSVIKKLQEEYSDKVGFVYRHFPITALHPNSFEESRAVYCVGKISGVQKMSEYIDQLFSEKLSMGNKSRPVGSKEAIANNIGVKDTDFKACLTGQESSNAITIAVQSGKSIGLNGVPSTFVLVKSERGYVLFAKFEGVLPYKDIKEKIDEALLYKESE